MDGVSIAASLVGVGTAGCQIAIKLYSLATQISTASQRISSISNDVALTSGVLKELGEFMTREVGSGGTSIFSQSGLDTTKSSAAICENIFNEIEQAAKEASQQLRTRDKFVGKIKLSKSEKAKWPFLQPSIESLRIDLREAKGTLMLMLQLMNLSISQRMATIDSVPNFSRSSHQTTTTDIVEQREIYRTILTLQKQTQGNSSSGKKGPVLDSTGNGTRRAVSSPSPGPWIAQRKESSLVADGEDVIVAESSLLPDQATALPSPSHVLIAMPGSDLPDSGIQQPTKESSNKSPSLRSTKSPEETEHHGMNPTSKESSSVGSNMPPLKSTVGTHREDHKILHLFVLKPYFEGGFDHFDSISIKLVHDKIPMQQADIENNLSSSTDNALQPSLDTYLQLSYHERSIINEKINEIGSDATLRLLKRTQVDASYGGIVFKGLTELLFALESRVTDREWFTAGEKPAIPHELNMTIRSPVARSMKERGVLRMPRAKIRDPSSNRSWNFDSTLDNMAGIPETETWEPMVNTSPSPSRQSSPSHHIYRNRSRDPSLERKLEKLRKLEALEHTDKEDMARQRAKAAMVLAEAKAAASAKELAASKPKINTSDDSDEVEEWSDDDAMDDEEAERAVKALLGKYTTLDPSILGGSA
ncbi:MAG: hypothetical protein Q9182_002851 [Xanthomendoza sp. 2 TL-2023]